MGGTWGSVLLLAGGLALLLAGGRLLVAGAVNIAERMGISTLVVGLTIVAWGTSSPELALNAVAASRGQTDLVLGNLAGANICNLTVILGVGALIRPLIVHASVIRREVPAMAVVLGGATALGLVAFPAADGFSRTDGIMILGAFALYTTVIVAGVLRRPRPEEALAKDVEAFEHAVHVRPMWAAIALFAGGLVLLGVGGSLASDGAAGVARALGMGERVIGVTIVSLATTFPELATTLIAVRRGHSDIAVGNAIGSCLFNVGCILPIAVLIHPFPVPGGGAVSLLVMCGLALAIGPMTRRLRGALGRLDGLLLLAAYAAYAAYEVVRALSKSSA